MSTMDALVDYIIALDCISLSLLTLPICSILLVGFLLYRNGKNDTMQRGGGGSGSGCGGKVNHNTKFNRDNANNYQTNATNVKHDSSESGITAVNGQHQQQQQQQQQQSPQQQNKQRRMRNNNNNNKQRQDGTGGNIEQKRTTAGFGVEVWLGQNTGFYDRYVSSCAEDNLNSHHNTKHRNSTSSEAAGSDDQQCSSSTEDLSSNYTILSKQAKKAIKARQRRQQKRKQQMTRRGNELSQCPDKHLIANNAAMQAMDIDDEAKENQMPEAHAQRQQQYHSNKASNFNRKQGAGKPGPLKPINKNMRQASSGNKGNKSNMNGLSTSNSDSSVNSTLSSASSAISISPSTSALNSPAHSASSSPTASPTASKRNAENYKKIALALAPPLRQHTKLNMTEQELVQHMRRYIIDPNLLRVYGYPVESAIHEGCIEIYKCLPKLFNNPTHYHHLHQHNRNFTHRPDVINTNDGLFINFPRHTGSAKQWSLNDASNLSGDSGQGSGDSSPPSMDSDSSEVGEDEPTSTTAFYTPDGSYQIFSHYDDSSEKQCVRCKRSFNINECQYVDPEPCHYHWGKLIHIYTGSVGLDLQYSCCQGEQESIGCSQHPMHVWTGAVVGLNGPYRDFVHTRPRYDEHETKIYALDCEMSYTARGLDVTKITVVGYDGQLVYEHFVRPELEIVDYNTRFSGVTEADLCTNSNKTVKTLQEVQHDLLQLFDADTILIGHALDNDLRVLRIVHKTIVDTSVAFPHTSGFPYRRALKHLTKVFLNRDIQFGESGHNSFEDSRACLELMLWKVRKEMRNDLQQ